MANNQSSGRVVEGARRALADQRHYQLGELLAGDTPARGDITDYLTGLANDIGCKLSTLYNAIGIYHLATQIGLSEEDVKRIGYTKLTVVATYATDDLTRDGLFALCEGRTVTGLKAAMAGSAGDVKVVTFALNKRQRRALDAALIRHGAVRSARGLVDKEAALMKLISKRK